MDYTSHAAAIAIQLGAASGLVGLFAFPAMAIRQSRRDAVLAERAWVQIRAERRAAALAAAGDLADAEFVPPADSGEPHGSVPPAITTAVIGSQRRQSVAH